MPSNFQIKGIREGLLVSLGEGTWPELQETLMIHIHEQENFFKGAHVALDVGNLILHAAEMGSLRDRLSDQGISLWALISNSPTTEQNAQMLGLATRLSTPKPERSVRTLDTNLTTGENAVLVQRTLRSGYKLSSKGHVIVIGDVNPGAEIIASGSVVIWGKLRGVVHAGAEGDEHAIVCALDLAPTQLRIADKIAIPPQRKGKSQPEIAHIQDNQVTAVSWNPKVK
ncbi:MAG TPA: septum site-determining protein MinC [Anaerolineaceae bacterium]